MQQKQQILPVFLRIFDGLEITEIFAVIGFVNSINSVKTFAKKRTE
jgi:hypothetical protein